MLYVPSSVLVLSILQQFHFYPHIETGDCWHLIPTNVSRDPVLKMLWTTSPSPWGDLDFQSNIDGWDTPGWIEQMEKERQKAIQDLPSQNAALSSKWCALAFLCGSSPGKEILSSQWDCRRQTFLIPLSSSPISDPTLLYSLQHQLLFHPTLEWVN